MFIKKKENDFMLYVVGYYLFRSNMNMKDIFCLL